MFIIIILLFNKIGPAKNVRISLAPLQNFVHKHNSFYKRAEGLKMGKYLISHCPQITNGCQDTESRKSINNLCASILYSYRKQLL